MDGKDLGQKLQASGPNRARAPNALEPKPFELKRPCRVEGLYRLQDWVAKHDALSLTLNEATMP